MYIRLCFLFLILGNSSRAFADIFGGDVAVLTAILGEQTKSAVELANLLKVNKELLEQVENTYNRVDNAHQNAMQTEYYIARIKNAPKEIERVNDFVSLNNNAQLLNSYSEEGEYIHRRNSEMLSGNYKEYKENNRVLDNVRRKRADSIARGSAKMSLKSPNSENLNTQTNALILDTNNDIKTEIEYSNLFNQTIINNQVLERERKEKEDFYFKQALGIVGNDVQYTDYVMARNSIIGTKKSRN